MAETLTWWRRAVHRRSKLEHCIFFTGFNAVNYNGAHVTAVSIQMFVRAVVTEIHEKMRRFLAWYRALDARTL